MTLDELNALSTDQAHAFFETTCASQRWCQHMADQRPYQTFEQLHDNAARCWEQLTDDDWLEAFKAHPMIGDIDSLRAKFANTKALAANEQSGTAEASQRTLEDLQQYNQAYREKHGFIFIICATGLSAQTMLDALTSRINNSTPQELANAAEQQLAITRLRLRKAIQAD